MRTVPLRRGAGVLLALGAVFAVLGGGITADLGRAGTTAPRPVTVAVDQADVPGPAAGATVAGATPEIPAVQPVGLRIPAIGVAESTVLPLRLTPSGRLEAPPDYARIGWYVGGAVPGDPGVAVIAGHVDSRSGPAVFFRLRDLRPGDSITVSRSDGRIAVFTVDDVRRYAKDDFPADEVYGAVPGSSLRLITCGGGFDRTVRSYLDNLVVFASAHLLDG